MLSEKLRSGMSETRKITKSTMEKKRRARINNSLTELKTIFGGMILNKSERFDKMEKADILEMTVKYVKQLQKLTETDTANCDKQSTDCHYSNGVHSCVNEVLKFITVKDDIFDADMKTKLLDHLACVLTGSEAKITNIDKVTDADTLTQEQRCFDSVQETSEMCKNDSNNNNNQTFCSNINENAINTTVLINCSTCNAAPASTAQFQLPSPSNPVMILPELSAYRPLPAGTNEVSVSMSAVPMTILVPANVYSSLGTACVIPISFNLQTSSPQIGNIIYRNNIQSPINFQHLKAESQTCIPFTAANGILSSKATTMSSSSTSQDDLCSATLNTNSNRTVFSATSVSDLSNQANLTASVATATSTDLQNLSLESHHLSNSSICTSALAFSSSGKSDASIISAKECGHQQHEAIEIRQSAGCVWRPW